MERILWYFADPMCSWCYGFSSVFNTIFAQYNQRIPIFLIVGGLRPGNTQPLGADGRTEILHHWHQVQQMTGAEFQFNNALPEDFIYNTEPACRAVVTISYLVPEATLPYFRHLQYTFYVEQADITHSHTLAELASKFGIDKHDFLDAWNSDEIEQKTQRNFTMTRQYSVKGFPTLILQDKTSLHILCNGYATMPQIEPTLLAWLEQSEAQTS